MMDSWFYFAMGILCGAALTVATAGTMIRLTVYVVHELSEAEEAGDE